MKRRALVYLAPCREFDQSNRLRSLHSFTLVEMLVSMAVLSILVALLCTIMNSTSSTIRTSWSRLESDQEARLVLDRLQIDFQNMLIRPDIDYEFLQVKGNDTLAFYCTQPGYYSSDPKRVASVVSYQDVSTNAASSQPMLQRGVNDAFQWSGSGSGPSAVSPMKFSATPTLSTTLSGVSNLEATSLDLLNQDIFRFELSFLLKNPPSQMAALPANTSITNVAAIIVTIAELDSQNRHLIPTTSWATLIAALPDATTGDTAQSWNTQLASPAFATTANIPAKAVAAIRVYERYFYLNSTP